MNLINTRNSLKTRVLDTVLLSYIISTLIIIGVSAYWVGRIITSEKQLAYEEELSGILHTLERHHDKLVSTGMFSVVEDSYRRKLLIELMEQYHEKSGFVRPFIMDSTGVVILHPFLNTDSSSLKGSAEFNTIIRNKNGTLDYQWDQAGYWAVYKTFEPWGWTLGYTISHRDKFSVIYDVVLAIFVISIICFALFLTAISFMLNRIVEPIKGLARDAAFIGEGNYHHVIGHIQSKDEVGQLARAFEQMLSQIGKKDYKRDELLKELSSSKNELEKNVNRLSKAEREVREFNAELEARVLSRTRQLETAHESMLLSAHKAGNAEVAISVLHNVGNILNSVVVSSEAIKNSLRETRLPKLDKANASFKEKIDELAADKDKLSKYQQYYSEIAKILNREREALVQNIERITEKVDSIKEVIMAQQSYASGFSVTEKLKLPNIVEDAISIQSSSIANNNILLKKDFQEGLPAIYLQKSHVIQILINLFKNSTEALMKNREDDRRIGIKVYRKDDEIYLEFSDNGEGITSTDLKKIFNFGYTTKPGGHGFGLHSSANYMVQMGGKIGANSQGPGKGAQFVLKFPMRQGPKPQAEED